MFVRMCLCVCVCLRERALARRSATPPLPHLKLHEGVHHSSPISISVCLCVSLLCVVRVGVPRRFRSELLPPYPPLSPLARVCANFLCSFVGSLLDDRVFVSQLRGPSRVTRTLRQSSLTSRLLFPFFPCASSPLHSLCVGVPMCLRITRHSCPPCSRRGAAGRPN